MGRFYRVAARAATFNRWLPWGWACFVAVMSAAEEFAPGVVFGRAMMSAIKPTPTPAADGREQLITIKPVCEILDICEATLHKILQEGGDLPKPIKVGGSTKWRAARIYQWIRDKDAAVNS